MAITVGTGTKLRISAQSMLENALTLSTATEVADLSAQQAYTDGSTAGKVNAVHMAEMTVDNGGDTTIDLESVTDAFGTVLNIDKVKALMIVNNSTTRTLTVGAAASTPLLIGGATDTIILQPGAFFAIAMAGTGIGGNLIKVAADGTTGTTTFKMWVLGVKAA